MIKSFDSVEAFDLLADGERPEIIMVGKDGRYRNEANRINVNPLRERLRELGMDLEAIDKSCEAFRHLGGLIFVTPDNSSIHQWRKRNKEDECQ